MEKETYFIFRHGEWPKTPEDKESENFKGLTEVGVEKTREKVLEISKEIEAMEEGSVLFFGGVIKAPRGRSTMKVQTDELKKIFKGRDDILFISQDNIKDMAKKTGYTKTVEKVIEKINKDPRVKVIVELPLWIKQFSDKRWWNEEKNDWGKYMKDVLLKNPKYMMEQWLTDRGKINHEQVGPNPDEVANNQLKGLKRIFDFVHRWFPNRPVIVNVVGHSLELDALLIYLANKGKVDIDGYQKIGGKVIQENEMAKIEKRPDGKIKLKYRNREFIFEEQQKHD